MYNYAALTPSGPFGPGGVIQTPDHKTGTATFTGSISQAKFTVGITIISSENDFQFVSGLYLLAGGGSIAIKPEKYDFKATPVGEPDVQFAIANTGDTPLLFTNLADLPNSPELDVGTPVGTIMGFTPFRSMLLVMPHSISETFPFSAIDIGKFLYIEGNVADSDSMGTPLDAGYQVRFGHQVPASEPSSWAVLGMALLCFGGLLSMRKRTALEFQARQST